jgi:hypothetical protein
MEKHPDKTFIGRIERGFDFLGFHFSRTGLTVAKATIEKFVERASRLYEQEPGEVFASTRFGMYVRRWVRWAAAGLGQDDRKIPIILGFKSLEPVERLIRVEGFVTGPLSLSY